MRLPFSIRRLVLVGIACGMVACGLDATGLLATGGDGSPIAGGSGGSGAGTGGGGPPASDSGAVGPTPGGSGSGAGGEGSSGGSGGNGSGGAPSEDAGVADPPDSTVPPQPADAATPQGDDGAPADAEPEDVHVLDPDASYSEAGDGCDLDQDGYLASGACGGTDCCDYDSRAHPGETAYYDTANACGGYDYDCNGVIQPEYDAAACALSGFGCTGDGFDKVVPACGVSGAFSSCTYDVLYCGTSASTRAQACR